MSSSSSAACASRMKDFYKYLETYYPFQIEPTVDFRVKFIDDFVNEAIHEFQWRLVEWSMSSKNQAILGMIRDLQKINYFHAPYCRCHGCPYHDDEKVRMARTVLKVSPWARLAIQPGVSYAFVGNAMEHMPFCECSNCKKMPAYIVPKYTKKMMKKILLHSPYDAFDLVSPEIMRPALFRWRNQTIDIAIQHVQKQNNNFAANRNPDLPYITQDAGSKRIKLIRR